MKTKPTTRKKSAHTKRVSVIALAEPLETAADYPSPARPLMTVKIRAHIAEFYGPDGALVSTIANGPRGSEAAAVLETAIARLRDSHALTVSHA